MWNNGLALVALLHVGCTCCPSLEQQTLDRFSEQMDLSIVYCGNKNGYAYFRWSEPTVPFSNEKCGKLPLENARLLSGWDQQNEFPYTNHRTSWIGAYDICDIVLSPDEKSKKVRSR